MLPGRLKIQVIAFLLLSAGVAGNLFLLQHNGRGAAIEQSGEQNGASALVASQSAGFDGHSSIGVPSDHGKRTALQPRFASNHDTGNADAGATASDDAVEITRAIQRELLSRGYGVGRADGVPGNVTRASIMAFESDHGLPLTGRADEKLLKYILLGSDGVPAKTSATGTVQSAEAGAVIRSIQQSLSQLGYRPGRINGRLDPNTAGAIRKFELDKAMPVSGRVSGPLVSRLARLTGGGQVASGDR